MVSGFEDGPTASAATLGTVIGGTRFRNTASAINKGRGTKPFVIDLIIVSVSGRAS